MGQTQHLLCGANFPGCLRRAPRTGFKRLARFRIAVCANCYESFEPYDIALSDFLRDELHEEIIRRALAILRQGGQVNPNPAAVVERIAEQLIPGIIEQPLRRAA